MYTHIYLDLCLDLYHGSNIEPCPKDDIKCDQIKLFSYIRAGNTDAMAQLIRNRGFELLQTVYTFPVRFKQKNQSSDGNDNEIENKRSTFYMEDGYDQPVTLEVFPIHLAIISKQESSLESILECCISEDTQTIGLENCPLDQIYQILSGKVNVKFPHNNERLYEDSDLMLDGMNILHLASKYHPSGLEIIIRFCRKHKGLLDLVKKMLLEKDQQIQNTPLHVAASSSSIVALR